MFAGKEHVSEIEVRYAETDKMGIVYHGNYLVWLEVARGRLLEEIGFPYIDMEGDGYVSPVLDCTLRYGAPCRYGDTILVYTRITKLTPVRTEYSYRIFAKGDDVGHDKPRFTGSSTHCLVDGKSFKPVNQKKVYPGLYEAYRELLCE